MDHSLPFYTALTTGKIKIWKNEKKTPTDVIIWHMCTINDNNMMYSSWDMEHDRQNFLSFWTIFLHFYSPNNPKNQNYKKIKKTPGDIITLHMCTINENHMMYGSWDMEHVMDRIFCHFEPFFALLPPVTTQKIKILQKWKTRLEISSFYNSYQKLWLYAILFLRYGAWWM